MGLFLIRRFKVYANERINISKTQLHPYLYLIQVAHTVALDDLLSFEEIMFIHPYDKVDGRGCKLS